jgi:hypothetical protein
MQHDSSARLSGGDEAGVAPCSIQISIRDADFPVVRSTLPHQLETIGQVARDIVVTLNRPAGVRPDPQLDALLDEQASRYRNLRVSCVDYGPTARRWVSDGWFGGARYPLVDAKGTPIHAYLEPFRSIEQPYLLHLDADMLLGGDHRRWLAEAIEVLEAEERVFAVSPLAGPPAPDGRYASGGRSVDTIVGPGWRVRSFSGRIYLASVEQFLRITQPIPLLPGHTRARRLRARATGYPDVDNLERLIGHQMLAAGLDRLDVGGSGEAWSLHPLHHTPAFVEALPDLIARVRTGDVPDAQRGGYDLHASMLDLPDIPGRFRRWRRTAGQLHPLRSREGLWS